jgi:hypothetical protein
VSLNLLFFAGTVVSGSVLVVLAVVYYKMRRSKKLSLDGFEKAEPKREDVTMPEAADYSPPKPEAVQVADLGEPESKSTFLAIMTKLASKETIEQ